MTKDKVDLTMTILELFLDVAQRSGCLYCLSRITAKVDPRDYKVDSLRKQPIIDQVLVPTSYLSPGTTWRLGFLAPIESAINAK